MSGAEPGYEILALDDLERLPSSRGPQLLTPLRRRLGFTAFGVNAWTGASAGDRVIEAHREPDGPEELYVVLRGAARFTVGEETLSAPAGTLIYVPPGTHREAIALEPETTVLAAGARAGHAYEPSAWEDVFVAYAHLRAGDPERGRAVMREALARAPGYWGASYDAACFEALAGERDAAFALLQEAVRLDAEAVRRFADGDEDLARIRDDPRYAEVVR